MNITNQCMLDRIIRNLETSSIYFDQIRGWSFLIQQQEGGQEVRGVKNI